MATWNLFYIRETNVNHLTYASVLFEQFGYNGKCVFIFITNFEENKILHKLCRTIGISSKALLGFSFAHIMKNREGKGCKQSRALQVFSSLVTLTQVTFMRDLFSYGSPRKSLARQYAWSNDKKVTALYIVQFP